MTFIDWLKNRRFSEGAAPAAPPKPITTPSKPKPKPDNPIPWMPPKPDRLPKAEEDYEDYEDYEDEHDDDRHRHRRKKKRLVREVYERDTNPYVRNFFSGLIRGGDSPMHKNPITAMHGERLAKKYYDEINPKYREQGFPTSNEVLMQLFTLLNEIQRIEGRHRAQLEEEAIRLVSEHTGIPEEFFRGFLNRPMEGGDAYGAMQNDNDNEENAPITPKLRHHINRMTNFNLLAQGHALGTMDTLHFKIKEIIDDIDPRLGNLYKKVSIGIKGNYFFSNMLELMQQAGLRRQGAIGEVQLKTQRDEDGNEVTKVYAKGNCFPVLVQELVKGAMDLVTSHGLTDLSDEERQIVKKHTDARFEDETAHFMIGPPLWKEFIKMVPPQYRQGGKLMQIIMQLARKEPKFVNDELRKGLEELQATSDTTTIHRIMHELMEELEEHNDEEPQFDQE
jgi:hypothetical protein